MTEPEELLAKGDSDSNTFGLYPLYFVLDGAGRLVYPYQCHHPVMEKKGGSILPSLPVLRELVVLEIEIAACELLTD